MTYLTCEDERGIYIQTYKGLRFHLLDPQPEEIDIHDIAHALSQQCRFTGHTNQFYSVAQHCVMVSQIVPGRGDGHAGYALDGLLHDASEAYTGDVSKPLKYALEDSTEAFADIERRIYRTIAEKFGLRWPPPAQVKAADLIALATEKRDFMLPTTDTLDLPPALPQKTVAWAPTGARVAFLDRFKELAS